MRAIPQWESLKKNIKIFVIQVVQILTSNSNDVTKILTTDLLNRISDLVKKEQDDLSLMINYTELMNNIVSHIDGVYWFMNSDTFELVLSEKRLNKSLYLRAEVEKLLLNAIIMLHKNDNERCFQLLDRIMEPLALQRCESCTPNMAELLKNAEKYLLRKNINNLIIAQERAKLKYVSTINLLSCLVETKSSELDLCKLLAEYNFEDWVWRMAFSNACTPDNIISFVKLIIYFEFNDINSLEKVQEILTTLSYLHLLAFLNERPGLAYDIMLQCMQLNTSLSEERKSQECSMDSQLDSNLFAFFIVPLQPFLDQYSQKHSKHFNLGTRSMVWQYPEIFSILDDKNKVEVIRSIFKVISRISNQIDKDKIEILFGVFITILETYHNIFYKDPQGVRTELIGVACARYLSSIVLEYPKFLAETITILDDLFKSQAADNWRILSETDIICYLCNLIDFEELDTCVKMRILSLIESIVNTLKPTNDPEINGKFVEEQLYPLRETLLKYMCHPEWRIRDSVIEIVKSMAIQSQNGFPTIVDFIVNSKFPTNIFLTMFNDCEDYAKISAMRCLQKMIKSDRIWNDCLSPLNLLAVMQSVFEENNLVDGLFPSDSNIVEQCESKRAVNNESRFMLKNILERLSEIGCLQVLWETLNDDCDYIVSRMSASILTNLVDILKRYDYLEEPKQETSTEVEQVVAQNGGCNQEQIPVQDLEPGSETIIGEDVINYIVDNRDTILLSRLAMDDVVSDDDQQRQTAKRVHESRRKNFTVDEFLSKLSSVNIEKFIQQKDEWFESTDDFNALMDTILGFDCNRDELINAIDCY
ncbi:hypothetical protein LSTR_LSTR002532 [Laodelphax striatellus]|uniref:Uncharacterized protein n=1 Tax=Laodelphax striatellus TaxID=195883 RepID=A0A482XMR9_LAOST|nr:hypothetical protein LSTR_LSTR002532 [Laodelphax striatellus]